MFRIRHLSDSVAPGNKRAITEIQAIIRAQFPDMADRDIDKIPDQVSDPMTHQFVTDVLVAENAQNQIRGFAIVMSDPTLKFAYLELISAKKGGTGGGVGAALYDHIREQAAENGLIGIFMECLPDDPAMSPDAAIRKQNADRLRFYARFGAYPIIGTLYETPVTPGTPDSPYLVFDGLGRHELPNASHLKRIVRAILERKYKHLCPPEYVEEVIASIKDGAYHLRLPRVAAKQDRVAGGDWTLTIPLVVNDKHDIHHVRERGYVEAPVRIPAILKELDPTGLFQHIEPKVHPLKDIKAVHDPRLVDYIQTACANAAEGRSVYPYVFPIRNAQRMPKEESVLAGYWCIDTFTPLNRNAFPAAKGAADCALTAADSVLNGARAAYALVRPPGHHAESKSFGGFCYFNNAAVAAHYLTQFGRVAVLDVDYHHGNGTQDIFYERNDVLTISIHGDPSFAYPYFTGFRDETGRGLGAGYNLNLPLPETITADDHRRALKRALARIEEFDPAYLVVALGLDAAKGDPTGTWPFLAADFAKMGAMIASVSVGTVFVQEGGYRVRNLGTNARKFFEGFASAARPLALIRAASPKPGSGKARTEIKYRGAVRTDDIQGIRRMVTATGAFSGEEIEIACELAEDRVRLGRKSGYQFIIATQGDRLAGYTCFGRTAGTEHTYDLYWIVVDPEQQQTGLGRELMRRTEDEIRTQGGASVIAETSSTDPYKPARQFYDRCGYELAATLSDFYRKGDDKLILRKSISANVSQSDDANAR